MDERSQGPSGVPPAEEPPVRTSAEGVATSPGGVQPSESLDLVDALASSLAFVTDDVAQVLLLALEEWRATLVVSQIAPDTTLIEQLIRELSDRFNGDHDNTMALMNATDEQLHAIADIAGFNTGNGIHDRIRIRELLTSKPMREIIAGLVDHKVRVVTAEINERAIRRAHEIDELRTQVRDLQAGLERAKADVEATGELCDSNATHASTWRARALAAEAQLVTHPWEQVEQAPASRLLRGTSDQQR